MGIGGLRATSLSDSNKANAGAKPPKTTSTAAAHRRVLWARPLVVF